MSGDSRIWQCAASKFANRQTKFHSENILAGKFLFPKKRGETRLPFCPRLHSIIVVIFEGDAFCSPSDEAFASQAGRAVKHSIARKTISVDESVFAEQTMIGIFGPGAQASILPEKFLRKRRGLGRVAQGISRAHIRVVIPPEAVGVPLETRAMVASALVLTLLCSKLFMPGLFITGGTKSGASAAACSRTLAASSA